jgi:hypothetical protein
MMMAHRSFLAPCVFLAFATREVVLGFQISAPTSTSGPHPTLASSEHFTTSTSGWSVAGPHRSAAPSFLLHGRRSTTLRATDGSTSGGNDDEEGLFQSEAEKKEAVGNLVEDDEWMGLSMELGELVRTAIIEDLKKNAREFLGKEEYKVGDISKEIDTRVKEEVARLRGCVNHVKGIIVQRGMITFVNSSNARNPLFFGNPGRTSMSLGTSCLPWTK